MYWLGGPLIPLSQGPGPSSSGGTPIDAPNSHKVLQAAFKNVHVRLRIGATVCLRPGPFLPHHPPHTSQGSHPPPLPSCPSTALKSHAPAMRQHPVFLNEGQAGLHPCVLAHTDPS